MRDIFSILKEYENDGLKFRLLNKQNIPEILKFQDANTTPDVFVKITQDEFLESAELDYVIGAYDLGKLVGFCLMIKNRATDRNLCTDINEDYISTATFDAVAVSREFRGHGLQKTFINLSCEIAKGLNPAPIFMAATVSPYNIYSKKNFLESGFEIKDEKEKYGGNLRLVVAKKIKD